MIGMVKRLRCFRVSAVFTFFCVLLVLMHWLLGVVHRLTCCTHGHTQQSARHSACENMASTPSYPGATLVLIKQPNMLYTHTRASVHMFQPVTLLHVPKKHASRRCLRVRDAAINSNAPLGMPAHSNSNARPERAVRCICVYSIDIGGCIEYVFVCSTIHQPHLVITIITTPQQGPSSPAAAAPAARAHADESRGGVHGDHGRLNRVGLNGLQQGGTTGLHTVGQEGGTCWEIM